MHEWSLGSYMQQSKHDSHDIRISIDMSSYDEICINCGAKAKYSLGGWGKLVEECPASKLTNTKEIIND